MQEFHSFSDFYDFYLSEHQNRQNRLLHFVGSCLVLLTVLIAVVTQQWFILLLAPFAGYGFAWIGHFLFEKNRPATFRYPVYSFFGDWVMFWQILTGRLSL